MIDPKEPKINNNVFEKEEEKYKQEEQDTYIQQDKYKEDQEEQEEQEDQEQEHYQNKENTYENEIKSPKQSFLSSYTYILLAIGLTVFVVYAIYYSFKYKENEKQYLIKSNATTFKTTIDDLQSDIKDFLKTKSEQFLNWKEKMQKAIDKYFFKKHIDNGVFKATKYKAANVLPTHSE